MIRSTPLYGKREKGAFRGGAIYARRLPDGEVPTRT
jgi:hypothetical protein